MTERILCYLPDLDERGDSEESEASSDAGMRFNVTWDRANLVSSLCDDGLHMPVLDLDGVDPQEAISTVVELLELRHFPGRLVPSTSEGHFHLYVDHRMTWKQYQWLLDRLCDRKIIQRGFRDAAIFKHFCTYVRKPGVYKKVLA